MRDTRIKKAELLKILEENKTQHRALYEEARENYTKAAAEALERKLDEVNRGLLVNLFIDLPVPEDHTRDYERVIRMIGLEVRDEIELPEADARMYVMDEWGWKRAWVANTVSYTASAGSPDYE